MSEVMSSDILEEMDLLDTFAPDTPPQVSGSAGGSVMLLCAWRRIACLASDTMHPCRCPRDPRQNTI